MSALGQKQTLRMARIYQIPQDIYFVESREIQMAEIAAFKGVKQPAPTNVLWRVPPGRPKNADVRDTDLAYKVLESALERDPDSKIND